MNPTQCKEVAVATALLSEPCNKPGEESAFPSVVPAPLPDDALELTQYFELATYTREG